MSSTDVVREYFSKLGAGDARGAFALLATPFSYRVMGTTPISGESHDMKELVEKTLRPFTSRLEGGQIQLSPDEFIASGENVVVLAHSKATATSGLPYDNEYAFLFRVRDGQIAEIREYLDTALVETAVFGKQLVG